MLTFSPGCDLKNTNVFLNTHGKNERKVPKELVTLLNYIREDIDGSERDFHDPYVKRFQKFIHEVKSKDGGTLYGF